MSETNMPGGLQSDDPLWSASHTDYIARLRARRADLELQVKQLKHFIDVGNDREQLLRVATNRLREKLRKCSADFKTLRDEIDKRTRRL